MEITPFYRPQVLLLGNGLNRAYNGDSWAKFLNSISDREEKCDDLLSPMPLRAIFLTNDKVDGKLKSRKKNNPVSDTFGKVEDAGLAKDIRRFLSLGFDEILTTNYTYEIEAAASEQQGVSENALKKASKNIVEGERVESKYLLSSYNQIKIDGETRRVWHIHGEARKPESMILGHYYYGQLFKRITEHFDQRKNDYQIAQREEKPIHIRSWLDSFILGDVYIIGFGLDFSEFDLWWLLNRKKREKAKHGATHFFIERFPCKTPASCGDSSCKYRNYKERQEKEKCELLRLLGVQVHEIPCANGDYNNYYNQSFEEIKKILEVRHG